MFKRTKSFRFVVATMVLALAGLIALQWHLLRQAMELKDQAFRRNALAALNTAVQRLETAEAYGSVLSATKRPDRIGPHAVPLRAERGKLVYVVTSPQHVRLQLLNVGEGRDSVVVDTFKNPGQYEVHLNQTGAPTNTMMYRYTIDSSQFYLQLDSRKNLSQLTVAVHGQSRADVVQKTVDRMFITGHESIERRVPSALLDSVLRSSFREAGITLGYDRGVFTAGDSLPSLVAPPGAEGRLQQSDIQARLFPSDPLPAKSTLTVDFPDQESFVIAQVVPLFGATAALTIVIVWGFAYAVRTIQQQKRLAGLMTDFVNNMTHEFKTPISTVSLAVEAIERADVIGQREKVRQYSSVIRDETLRMRRQVEKILEMATIEQGEYELHIETVNVHDLVREVSSGLALQIAQRGGILTYSLEAQTPVVFADRIHLANIVNNLLDNANKYSPEHPSITITTMAEGDRTIIAVTDKGIGIPAEFLPHVFDKYFRVPTGNRHDVKGFGLGLSYVKVITEAMGGTVSIRSTLGEGTTGTLAFRRTEAT